MRLKTQEDSAKNLFMLRSSPFCGATSLHLNRKKWGLFSSQPDHLPEIGFLSFWKNGLFIHKERTLNSSKELFWERFMVFEREE